MTAEGGRHFAVAASDVTIEPARALDATRPLFTVRFDGAPGSELSGDFGHAWHAIAVMAAAESVGVAARVTRTTVEYAKERKQFGRAIGSYQAVSHACAQMFLETEGARSVTFWAAWALDHDPETAYMAANCAKAYASDAAVNVARSALQVHGGIGFTWEHDLHLFLNAPRRTPTRTGTRAGTASRSPPHCSGRTHAGRTSRARDRRRRHARRRTAGSCDGGRVASAVAAVPGARPAPLPRAGHASFELELAPRTGRAALL